MAEPQAEFLPEAILRGGDDANEGQWKVARAEGIGQSCTDLSRRLITIPEASSDGRVLTRLHEGLHVKYSPTKPKPGSRPSAQLFRQMLEEIRVDSLGATNHALDMTHRFDDYDLGPKSPLWVQKNSHQEKLRAALYYLQTYAQRTSPEVKPLHDHLRSLFTSQELSELHLYAEAAANPFYARSKEWDEGAIQWAEKLAEEFDPPPPPIKIEKAQEKPQPKPKPGEQGEPSIPDQQADLPKAGAIPNGGHGGAERQGTWTLCRHINRANPGKTLRLPMGAKDRGSEPKLWHRFCEDKQIFSNRRMGGTLLIDASGSMNWDYDALRRAMREFPAATVAIYEGTGQRAKYGNGVLCIVAESGRWDNPARPNCAGRHHSGGNDIDLESLQWLARQKAPRLWLSDAGVCGGAYARAHGSEALRTQCYRTARTGRIARTLHAEEAIKFFRRRGNHRSSLLHVPTEGQDDYMNPYEK